MMVINNGCKYLQINTDFIEGDLKLNQESSLIYLKFGSYMSMNSLNTEEISEKILASCYSLQKLSFVSCPLTIDAVKSICYQNGKTLQVLELTNIGSIASYYEGSNDEFTCLKLILENCQCLKEVKFDKSIASEKNAYYLVKNITATIEVFSISSINDKQLKILVKRCKKIKTLKSASTDITGKSLKLIIKTLKTTLQHLEIDHTKIDDPVTILGLRAMPSLRILTISPLSSIKDELKKYLPLLNIREIVDHGDICHDLTFYKQFSRDFSSKEGIWEIKAKELQLFRKHKPSSLAEETFLSWLTDFSNL